MNDKGSTAWLWTARVEETVLVIRLAISCDICGTEKKQTNHWFVAYEHAGELRIGGWNSRYCKRPGSRHLCGQTCLHKLMDEFMAKTIAGDREMAAAEMMSQEQASPEPSCVVPLVPAAADEDEYGSSARLIPTPVAASAVRPESPMPPVSETPKYGHPWRTGAWERERKREMHGR